MYMWYTQNNWTRNTDWKMDFKTLTKNIIYLTKPWSWGWCWQQSVWSLSNSLDPEASGNFGSLLAVVRSWVFGIKMNFMFLGTNKYRNAPVACCYIHTCLLNSSFTQRVLGSCGYLSSLSCHAMNNSNCDIL